MIRIRRTSAAIACTLLFSVLLPGDVRAQQDICQMIDLFGRPLTQRVLEDREQVRPLVDHPLRDPSICRGPDGWYYLTGTDGTPILDDGSGPDFLNNDGIRLWRSRDLDDWEPLGKVFSLALEDMGTRDRMGFPQSWRRRPVVPPGVSDAPPARGIQAPEIHYIHGTFWITYSIAGEGGGLLKSESGKPEGPYVDWAMMGDEGFAKGKSRLTFQGGSLSLFEDDDGAVYLLYGNGRIARLRDDLKGFAEPPRMLLCHNPEKTGPNAMDYPLQVGRDGYFLKKLRGRYYLFAADWTTRAGESVQDVYVAWSDNVFGPYSERRWSIPHCGQTTVFEGPDGKLLATYFGNDPHAAFRDRAGIVPLGWTRNDHPTRFRPDSPFPRKLLRVNTERYPWHRLPPVSRYMMRDVQACRGPDGAIYYTGSHVDARTGGRLFIYRSTDMIHWQEIEVWDWDRQKRLLAEPFPDPRETDKPLHGRFTYMDAEIWYLNDTFYIGYSVYGAKPGQFLLRSTTGKAEGPYEFVNNNILCQPSFFQDDDGRIYFSANSMNVPWQRDMSGPIQEPAWGRNPAWPADGSSHLGDSSGQTTKILGRYVHFTTGWDGYLNVLATQSAIDCYTWNYMTSDSIEGPWTRERVLPHVGHGALVEDRFGNWWACFFGCEGSQALPSWGIQTAGIAPCEVRIDNGELIIRLADRLPDYAEKALQESETKH